MTYFKATVLGHGKIRHYLNLIFLNFSSPFCCGGETTSERKPGWKVSGQYLNGKEKQKVDGDSDLVLEIATFLLPLFYS